jgi:archaellum component FlaG (FlaF/FlaG flagellin family)
VKNGSTPWTIFLIDFLIKNNHSNKTMTTRKFYKTVITIEVLSEEVYAFDSLEQTAYDIQDGGCSGKIEVVKSEELNGENVVKALNNQGSASEFFMLDEDGNDLV